LETLYSESDSSTQLLIRSTIAEALKDCPKIIESHGSDWVLCTLASFHKPEDDTMRIYQAIMTNLEKFYIGLLDENIKLRNMNEVADSCLIGLSFFRKHLEQKYQRKSLPSPDYWSKVGSVAFYRLGYDKIGEEFNLWVNFINKEMTND
jgi:hypothetical protein